MTKRSRLLSPMIDDDDLERRVEELMPTVLETAEIFGPVIIADMLAYAAARLERIGFEMFPCAPREAASATNWKE
ncbi:hypothetical protein [Sphingobium sp. TomTYG45]